MSAALALLIALCYLGFAWLTWRQPWPGRAPEQPSSSASSAPPAVRPIPWRVIQGGLTLPLLGHAWLVLDRVLGGAQPDLGVANAVALIVWLSVALYWTAGFFQNVRGLEPPLLVVAALSVLLELAIATPHWVSYSETPWFKLHLLVAILSQALFTLAAIVAGLIELVDRNLHRHTRARWLGQLPPLLVLERWMFHLLVGGFTLLSITLISGVGFSEALFQRPARFDHKTVLGVLAWVTFGSLLLAQQWRGIRGRRAARWLLGGYALLLLAYLGTKFVLQVLLGR